MRCVGTLLVAFMSSSYLASTKRINKDKAGLILGESATKVHEATHDGATSAIKSPFRMSERIARLLFGVTNGEGEGDDDGGTTEEEEQEEEGEEEEEHQQQSMLPEIGLTEIQNRLDEVVEQFRCRLNAEAAEALSRMRAAAQAEDQQKHQRIESERAGVARLLDSAVTPLSSELLLSDIVHIRIEGQIVNVHSSVLANFDYFEARLSGAWIESGVLELELPRNCSLEDFLVLIHHFYSSRKSPLVFQSLSGSLRAALMASMLLADDQTLAEIAAAISRLVMTKEDALAVRAFIRDHQLPEVFGSVCSFEEMASMDVVRFREMVTSAAETVDCQKHQLADAIIAAQVCGSAEYKTALIESIQFLGKCRCCGWQSGTRWWLERVMEYASVAQVVVVLKQMSAPQQICPTYCRMTETPQWFRELFFKYLRTSWSTDVASLGFRQTHLYFGKDATGLQALSEVLQHQDAAEISKAMAESSAEDLAGLLDPQVLTRIPGQKQIISKLCTNADQLSKWASVEKLNALSLENRRIVSMALATRLSSLPDDVVQVVRNTL